MKAVNAGLTLRNWLIGFHIAECEQRGTDRAQYGDELIERLSDRLMQAGVSRAEARELRRYRRFYLTYPRMRESLSPELGRTLLPHTDGGNNRESLTPKMGIAASEVLTKLSFSHIAEQLAAGALGETNIRHITGGESGSSEGDLNQWLLMEGA